jgi:hypothetical protein
MTRRILPALGMLSLALAACSGPSGAQRHVYRDDLKRNPENGWSLYGLRRSLEARDKMADAAAVDARFRKAWAGADVTLTASRF